MYETLYIFEVSCNYDIITGQTFQYNQLFKFFLLLQESFLNYVSFAILKYNSLVFVFLVRSNVDLFTNDIPDV